VGCLFRILFCLVACWIWEIEESCLILGSRTRQKRRENQRIGSQTAIGR
jgi:hypothetical protein